MTPYKFFKCDFTCHKNFELSTHTTSVHEMKKPYKCSKCDFTCQKNLNWAHISPQCMKWRNLPYKCSKWALVFSKTKNWAHMTLVHQPQFACDICKKTFTRKAYVKKHTCSKKNPEKKHLCKFCNKMFSSIQ